MGTNLRPITLLPTFYKITSGVLTARLKPIFDRLISPWQKAYLPNRFIGDITRNTFHLFQHAKSNNLPGLMLQIDFSKAFDSISFEFIENTLKLFNLNPKYISWINNPTQNSTHRFYHCPQAQETWQLLTHITSQTPHPHYFSFTTAILNVLHLTNKTPTPMAFLTQNLDAL